MTVRLILLTAQLEQKNASAELISIREDRQNVRFEDIFFFRWHQAVVHVVVFYFKAVIAFDLKVEKRIEKKPLSETVKAKRNSLLRH